jgi:hypothetical protein
MRLSAYSRLAQRHLRRGFAVLVVLAAGAVALPTGAAARPPVFFTDSGTNVVDSFLTPLCGTDILITYTYSDKTVFFDEDSEFPRMVIATWSATITGPGGTLIEREAWRTYETGDSFTVTGLPFRMLSPDGGVVIRDAGFVRFTEDSIEVVHGPHPALFGEFDVCSYLV